MHRQGHQGDRVENLWRAGFEKQASLDLESWNDSHPSSKNVEGNYKDKRQRKRETSKNNQ